jgi:hypothetical protein
MTVCAYKDATTFGWKNFYFQWSFQMINPALTNGGSNTPANSPLLTAAQTDPHAAELLQISSMTPVAIPPTNETTVGSLGASNTLNVSSGSINPSANQQSVQIAQSTPRQQTQNGLDRANGFAGGVGLVNNALTRRAIYNDINRVSDQIDQRIAKNGPGTGTLVSTTTNNPTWLSPRTYAGTNVSDSRTTPPTGRFDTIGRADQSTTYTWVSETRPANLAPNVNYMTPDQYRSQAALFAF